LDVGRGVVEMIKITCIQLNSKNKEEKGGADKLEQISTMVYDHIPDIM